MGAVERTLIMKLQGAILVLAVLVGQLQCAPSGCRGCEWDNTGHSSGHTTGQSKRSGDPADTDALLPQNWWESKEPMGDGAINVKRADPADTGAILPTGPSNVEMGDGAINVKRSGAEPRGCRGCEWDDTENLSGPPQEAKRSDPADAGAIVPTGPSNLPMGDGAISVKRSDGNPADIDALLPQNWWESKVPMGDGAVSVKRADPADTGAIVPTGPSNLPMGDGAVNVKRADPADTGAIVPTGPSNQPMGDAAINVKRSGAEPRGCRGCEWDDTENPSGPPQENKRSNPADTGAIVPTGPSNLPMGDGAISVKRSPMSDNNPADNLFYPSDDGFSTSGDGDAAINVKRSGAEPRGCRDCEWADTENPSGPRNEAEPRRLSEGSDAPNGAFGPPPIYSEDKRGIENSTNPRFYPCEGPYCVGDKGWGKRAIADTDAIPPTGPSNSEEGDAAINI